MCVLIHHRLRRKIRLKYPTNLQTEETHVPDSVKDPVTVVNEVLEPKKDDAVVIAPSDADVARFEHESDIGKLGHVSTESKHYWTNFLEESDVNKFMEDAYNNPRGYAIRVNPITGKKEMMIAGTRARGWDMSTRDWVQNVAEGIHHAPLVEEFIGEENWEVLDMIGTYSEHKRDQGSARYAEIARAEGVEVVYGHSRGAAIMSGMDGDWDMIGIDGAAFIGHDVPYTNIVMKWNPFDRGIAMGHKGNVGVVDRGFHNVSVKKKKLGTRVKAATKKVVDRSKKRAGRAKHGRAKKRRKPSSE